VFQLWLLRLYPEKDYVDVLLRASLIPEFIYGYMMTFALIGSYSFLVFNLFKKIIWSRVSDTGERFFRMLGYAQHTWGTRRVV
jgi:hypothetical protein